MLLYVGLNITVRSANVELQDMHIHIKSKIICRKEILNIAVLHSLIGKVGFDHSTGNDDNISPKLKAFGELEKMVRPIPELDYKKELEDARDEKYGRSD